MDNAIKFSPNQGIITMFLKQENDQVKFILEDEGPGIDEEIKTGYLISFIRQMVPIRQKEMVLVLHL